MINIPKGTKDVLPTQSHKWHFVEDTVKKAAALFNVREIRTPAFEHTELFLRGIGDSTDVVSKEMYTFEDKKGRSITLKPEGTAPAARSFIENNLDSVGIVQKLYYITPVFRYEQPQAGRLREHHQFGVEFFGSPNPQADAEVIALAHYILSSFSFSGLNLLINNIGCQNCRQDYNKALKAFLIPHSQKLCSVCNERIEKNPLRVLDCKIDCCKEVIKDAPKICDFVCDDCKNHMSELLKILQNIGIKYSLCDTLVRGLDYYTKTVFEFVSTSLGAQGTVCGGGRYDSLIQNLGGRQTPAVGFGMGLERLIMMMEAQNVKFMQPNSPKIFVASIENSEAKSAAISLAFSLRQQGINAEYDLLSKSLKAQMKYADKLNAQYAVVIGDDELKTKKVMLKNMTDGSQKEVEIAMLASALKD